MSDSNGKLIVSKIEEGTVIDHIPAGKALKVLSILGITGEEGYMVALVMNVTSKRLGKKDIVKVEGRFLSKEEVDRIALIAPTATINIVKGFEVVEKMEVELPDEIEGIVKCMNPNCVTNQPREHVTPKFRVLSRKPVKLECLYCGEVMKEEEIESMLSRD